MSIVYTSKINSLVISPTYTDASGNSYTNAIMTVLWTYTATQGDYTYSIYPETILKEPSSVTFTDYQTLTEEEILTWVFDADTCISSYQLFLQIQLKKMSNEIVNVAWSNNT